MIRYGTAILIAAGACVATGVAACGDDSVGPPVSGTGGSGTGGSGTGATSNGGSGTGGGGGATPGGKGCDGACCPSAATCYSTPAGKTAPGAECMARIENTPTHIQLRQTWINLTSPPGNAIPVVLSTLNTFTQLKEPECNTPTGGTGYMQALDLDLKAGVSTLGYVTFISDNADAVKNGLCFVDVGTGVDAANAAGGWKDIADYDADPMNIEKNYDFSLTEADMSPTDGWPEGLPPPKPQPWKITPTKAKRLMTDFNLATDRAKLIKDLTPTGDLGKDGFTGVFFYDPMTGISHGYSPVSNNIIYDPKAKPEDKTPTSFIAPMIREAEISYKVNDPMAPNCVGKYNPQNLDPMAQCVDPGAAMKPAWGGIFDTVAGSSDAKVLGYFLITELEQIYSKVLKQTLCVSQPIKSNSVAAGWATETETRCRKSPKWDPKHPKEGLPMGDWCAATNSAATPDCHDAYQSKSFHAFQSFRIKTEHCKPF